RLGRSLAGGPSPGRVAITALGPGPAGGDQTKLPASTTTIANAAHAAARTVPRHAEPILPVMAAITRYARHAPASASRRLSNGGPPIATQPVVGAVAWLIASRPHGKPHGQRSCTASTTTHQPATGSGQNRSRSNCGSASARPAMVSASATARANQAYQATLISQDSSPTKNTSPQVNVKINVTA